MAKGMAWTREQAIEMNRKGGRKGGLARAARLSPDRPYEIAVIGRVTKWRLASSELGLIDRHLTKLAASEAYAMKHGDIDRYERVVRADSIVTGTDVGSAVKRSWRPCGPRARGQQARLEEEAVGE